MCVCVCVLRACIFGNRETCTLTGRPQQKIMQLTSPNWLRKSTSRRTQFKMDIPIRSAHRGQFCTLRHRHNPFSLPTGCQYVLFCGSEQRTKDHVETGQRNAGLRNKPAGWVKKQWHWFGDRAQAACQFLKLHLPKVLRPGVLLLLTLRGISSSTHTHGCMAVYSDSAQG